jgi:hypothetical protein
MRAKLECASEPRDRRDHVFVPTGGNEANARRRCGAQSHTVDYKAMQKQTKSFSFRKTFREVFSPSPKSGQSIRELQ